MSTEIWELEWKEKGTHILMLRVNDTLLEGSLVETLSINPELTKLLDKMTLYSFYKTNWWSGPTESFIPVDSSLICSWHFEFSVYQESVLFFFLNAFMPIVLVL